MSLSRKSQKQLKKLKSDAGDLWLQQQKVLDQAGKVADDARKKLTELGKAELQPRFEDAVQRVKPTLDQGVHYARATANVANDKLTSTVLPAIGATVASAMTVARMASNPAIRSALMRGQINSTTLSKVAKPMTKKEAKRAEKRLEKQIRKMNKKKGGFGRVLLIGVGITALAGAAWATWQALRADDDLWAEDISD